MERQASPDKQSQRREKEERRWERLRKTGAKQEENWEKRRKRKKARKEKPKEKE